MCRLGVYHVHVMKTGGTSLARMLPFPPHRSYPTPDHPETRPYEKHHAEALLAISPEEQYRFVLVSTHMGARVAEDLFPDYVRVTVLRDPVERNISHLRQIAEMPGSPVDLEEIYDNPVWHSRLVNHQVQVFALSRAEFLAQEPDRRALYPSRHTEQDGTWILTEEHAAVATSIAVPKLIDESSYAEAAARLDRVDEVGVTERLGELVGGLGVRLGRELGPLRHDRASEPCFAVSAALRERIERENEWDWRLYERALARQTG